ncbi:MAG: hypothetical protein J6T96_05445 [Bacteroidales bacterium]|nr:hypothetical protein [Bacteroidales bacterium]
MCNESEKRLYEIVSYGDGETDDMFWYAELTDEDVLAIQNDMNGILMLGGYQYTIKTVDGDEIDVGIIDEYKLVEKGDA